MSENFIYSNFNFEIRTEDIKKHQLLVYYSNDDNKQHVPIGWYDVTIINTEKIRYKTLHQKENEKYSLKNEYITQWIDVQFQIIAGEYTGKTFFKAYPLTI